MTNISVINDLLENIKNITYYYVKKEYKYYLKQESKKYMELDEIQNFSNSLFDNNEVELKNYILEELNGNMMENRPDDKTIIDTIDEMIDDRDLVINRLVTEIDVYQIKKRDKKERKKKEKNH